MNIIHLKSEYLKNIFIGFPNRNLKLSWFRTMALFIIIWFVSFMFLKKLWMDENAIRWFFISGIILVYELYILWRILKYHVKGKRKKLLNVLGFGNVLTLTRGLLIAFVGGFLFSARPAGKLGWLPALFYLIAAIADRFDGYFARKKNLDTLMGQKLDVEYDALGLFVAPVLAIQYGQLPMWYIFVPLSRYAFIAGTYLLRKFKKPIYDLTPSNRRRYLAGFQMGITGVALSPLFDPLALHTAATLFLLPFMAGFIRDWLVVSGLFNPLSMEYSKIKKIVLNIMYMWLPFILRIMLFFLISYFFIFDYSKIILLFFENVQMNHLLVSSVLILLIISTTLLIITGTMGRMAAFVLAIIFGLFMNSSEVTANMYSIFTISNFIMIIGSGVFSTWKPDEDIINRRAGETLT